MGKGEMGAGGGGGRWRNKGVEKQIYLASMALDLQ